MSLGMPQDKATIDRRMGQTASSLVDAFRAVEIAKEWLDTKSVADLEAAGYTTGEANILKSAYTDLDSLRQVYQGAATQGSAKDFRTFAKQLIGVN